MEVRITTFMNPFSFFCIPEKDASKQLLFESLRETHGSARTNDLGKLIHAHGQYIAVLYQNKWVRGIVNVENHMQIWLVDHGVYLRADEKTVWRELSSEDKKIPSRVFEASIHGVLPVDKEVDEDCQIIDKTSTTWTKGAILKAKEAIASSNRVLLQPVAFLSTSYNDVVLADLYLDIPEKGVVNLVEELDVWPHVMDKDQAAYIDNLEKCYKERRRHRACAAKPDFPGLGALAPGGGLAAYRALCAAAPAPAPPAPRPATPSPPPTLCHSDCSTVVEQKKLKYFLTPEEMEEYATMYVNICGREYNLLNVLVNKVRDLNMCEMYKDHDLKAKGRGVYYRKY